MNILRTCKFDFLLQQLVGFCLGVVLAIGIVLSYSQTAQAAIDTTSAATRADANQIEQRKETAPHYPNWYEDQRSLESYMDSAGVDANERGNSPTDQNDDRGYNPIKQDRVNGYYADSERSGLIDRSQDKIKDAAANLRETLSPNSSTASFSTSNYTQYDTSSTNPDDLGDRVADRLERAKEVFQEATERTAQGGQPIITGESNR